MDIRRIRHLLYANNNFSKDYYRDLAIKDRIWDYLMGYSNDISKVERYLRKMDIPPLKWRYNRKKKINEVF